MTFRTSWPISIEDMKIRCLKWLYKEASIRDQKSNLSLQFCKALSQSKIMVADLKTMGTIRK